MSLKKYEDAVEPRLLEVQAWARCNVTEKAMAKKLGISYSTFRNYKKQHLALLGTLRESRAITDIKVENAMLKRAVGYKTVDVVTERVYNRDTKEYEFVVTKETIKEVNPDVGTATFWLKNRKPDDWKEKVEEELF